MWTKDFCKFVIVSFNAASLNVFITTFQASYLPSMMHWFGYRDQEIAHAMGMVTCSYYMGAFLLTYPSKILADRYGRRIILVSINLIIAVCSTALAFCTSLVPFCLVNFFLGISQSLDCLTRIIPGVDKDSSTAFIGMYFTAVSWAFGACLAWSVTAYLTKPMVRYPHVFDTVFFIKHPYFWPPIFSGCLGIFGAAISGIVLPSTDNIYDLEATESIKPKTSTHYKTFDINDKGSPSLAPSSQIGIPISSQETSPALWKLFTSIFVLQKFINKTSALVLTGFILRYSANNTHQELFSLWLTTYRHLGGLGYTSKHKAIIQLETILPCIILLLLIIPLFQRTFRFISSMIIYLSVALVLVAALPILRFIQHGNVQWICVLLVQTMITVTNLGGSDNMISLLQSSSSTNVSMVVGIGYTFAALLKAVLSIAISSLFSISIESKYADTSLSFVIVGALYWVTAIVIYLTSYYFTEKYKPNN